MINERHRTEGQPKEAREAQWRQAASVSLIWGGAQGKTKPWITSIVLHSLLILALCCSSLSLYLNPFHSLVKTRCPPSLLTPPTIAPFSAPCMTNSTRPGHGIGPSPRDRDATHTIESKTITAIDGQTLVIIFSAVESTYSCPWTGLGELLKKWI